MLSKIIDAISKLSTLVNVVITPILLFLILKNIEATKTQLSAFNQLILTMQAVDNTTLSETTSISQLIRIMTAAATGKSIAGLSSGITV